MPHSTRSEDGTAINPTSDFRTKKRRKVVVETDPEEELGEASEKAVVSTPSVTSSAKRKRRKRKRSEASKHKIPGVEVEKMTSNVDDDSRNSISKSRDLQRQSSNFSAEKGSPLQSSSGFAVQQRTNNDQKNVTSTLNASTSKESILEGSSNQSELISKLNKTIETHESLIGNVIMSLTCQICLESMTRPFTLAPCGHTSCYECLLSWFRAAPPEALEQPVPEYLEDSLDIHQPTLLRINSRPLLNKKKTCPHCRRTITEAPFEAWTIKAIIDIMRKSELVSSASPSFSSEPGGIVSSSHNQDPWHGVFRIKEDINQMRNAAQNAGFLERDLLHDDFNPQVADPNDIGIFDEEDDVRRCTLCLHELWDSTCTGCGRNYPGLERQNFAVDHDHDDGDHVLPGPVRDADIELQRAYIDLVADAENGENVSEDGSYESSFIDDDEVIRPIEFDSDNSYEERHLEPWRSVIDVDSQDESNDFNYLHRLNGTGSRRIAILSDDQDGSDNIESHSPSIQRTLSTRSRRRPVLLSDEEELNDVTEVEVRPRPALRRNFRSSRTIVASDDESVENDLNSTLHHVSDDSALTDSPSDEEIQSNITDMMMARERILYGDDDFVRHADNQSESSDEEFY